MKYRLALLIPVAFALIACGKPAGLEPVTLTAAQQKLFENSCKNCHGAPDNPAPHVGDKAAWEPRIAKGLDQLVKNAMAGYNQMPAGGMCVTCTPQDYEALIRYMATAPKAP